MFDIEQFRVMGMSCVEGSHEDDQFDEVEQQRVNALDAQERKMKAEVSNTSKNSEPSPSTSNGINNKYRERASETLALMLFDTEVQSQSMRSAIIHAVEVLSASPYDSTPIKKPGPSNEELSDDKLIFKFESLIRSVEIRHRMISTHRDNLEERLAISRHEQQRFNVSPLLLYLSTSCLWL